MKHIVEICTIIGTAITVGIVLYNLGRLSSKVDSNTHRLNQHDNDIKDINDKLYDLNKG